MGRIEVVLAHAGSAAEVRDRLRYVFGIANFSVATRVAPDLEAIAAGILRDLPAEARGGFRVRVRRADKRFPVPLPPPSGSSARIGAARGWAVNLDDPGLAIGVEIVPGEAFYHFGKEPGAGACRPARVAAWWRCCPAASTHRWRHGG